MFLNGRLECDKLFCVKVYPEEPAGLTKPELLWLAAFEGWHVPPCNCRWRNIPQLKYMHRRDYCPEHFPVKPRGIEDLPPL